MLRSGRVFVTVPLSGRISSKNKNILDKFFFYSKKFIFWSLFFKNYQNFQVLEAVADLKICERKLTNEDGISSS